VNAALQPLNDVGHEVGCRCPTCLPEAHALATGQDTYEWNGVRFYVFKGRTCCIAAAAGRYLGYADNGGHLVEVIRKEWAKENPDGSVEMLEGQDFAILKGDELREFKKLLKDSEGSSLSSTARLMVLFESGIDLVCQKTDKPQGVELRRHLADKILPRLRRGETITAKEAAQVPLFAPAVPPPSEALAPAVAAPPATLSLDAAAIVRAVVAEILPELKAQIQMIIASQEAQGALLKKIADGGDYITGGQAAKLKGLVRLLAEDFIKIGWAKNLTSAVQMIRNPVYSHVEWSNTPQRVEYLPKRYFETVLSALRRQQHVADTAKRRLGLLQDNVIPLRSGKST
jgi:hypothetical protein